MRVRLTMGVVEELSHKEFSDSYGEDAANVG